MGADLGPTGRRSPARILWKIIAILPFLLANAASPPLARAQPAASDTAGRRWAIVGEAATDTDLSGAACAPDGRCLLVSDEKRRAWFFALDQRQPAAPKIVIGERVKLTPTQGGDEADAEGAAFDGGRFYAIGSHGTSRRKGEFQASRYSTYRIEADGSVKASIALSGIIAAVPGIREHFCAGAQPGGCQSLQDGGANIEGLAARNGQLYIGFRAPAPGGKAFIVRVAEGAVFGQADPGLAVFRLELGRDGKGRDLGIRDLAAVSDGFLVLAGPSLPEGDEAVGSGRVLHWREGDERPRLLREIVTTDKGVKPEVLLVIGESPTAYRVLIMSDGIAGGSPTEFELGNQ
jgi:hypothetical protein